MHSLERGEHLAVFVKPWDFTLRCHGNCFDFIHIRFTVVFSSNSISKNDGFIFVTFDPNISFATCLDIHPVLQFWGNCWCFAVNSALVASLFPKKFFGQLMGITETSVGIMSFTPILYSDFPTSKFLIIGGVLAMASMLQAGIIFVKRKQGEKLKLAGVRVSLRFSPE